MSDAAVAYVAQHVRGLTSGQARVLYVIAHLTRGEVCRANQATIGSMAELSRGHVCRIVRTLRERGLIKFDHRTYTILGATAHDVHHCDADHCQAQSRAIRRAGRGRLKASAVESLPLGQAAADAAGADPTTPLARAFRHGRDRRRRR